MTLNTVKPRSAITLLSPSMVCATDLLLGLVITPSEDCVLSSIGLPFEGRGSWRPWDPVIMPGLEPVRPSPAGLGRAPNRRECVQPGVTERGDSQRGPQAPRSPNQPQANRDRH